MEYDHQKFFLTYVLSMLCHLIFFVMVIVVPDRMPEKKLNAEVIHVSMVNLTGESPSGKTDFQTEQQEISRKKERSEAVPVAESVPDNTVSTVTPQTKEKVSLKKKTFKPSTIVKSALERLEKTVEDTAPSPLKEALERLEKEVGKTEAMDRLKGKVDLEKAGSGTASLPGSGTGIQKIVDIIDIYRLEIAYRVQKNWAFSGQLAGDTTDLQASLVFKVMPSGEIRDVFFTDRSGNTFLDESAYKAILKSNPVDPHPAGMNTPYVNVGLRFTPAGLK